jgi:non-canonical purine NTP pyrophosphatase (RdgB/HAM1 family)
MNLIFATGNAHKASEVQSMMNNFGLDVSIQTLKDIGFEKEIIEDGDSFEANSLIKAQVIFDETGIACFSEDSGLVVDALDGSPGIYTARYAGEDATNEENMKKVLTELGDEENRAARFVAVVTYISNSGEVTQFRGEVEGTIALEMRGEKGFGYDPIFIPNGYEHTFGELGNEVKDEVSHRKNAIEKFVAFLQS